VDAVVHGRRAGEVLSEHVGLRDIDASPFDQRMLGAAAGAREESDRVSPVGQLERDRGTHGPGAVDDVELVLGKGGHEVPFEESECESTALATILRPAGPLCQEHCSCLRCLLTFLA